MTPIQRCTWCTSDDIYIQYHDEEWGVPEFGFQALFERLVLEGMQAGLSWITVLKKRDHMRNVFYQFDPYRLAAADERDMARWLDDPGIIRHRGKLAAMISNAQCYLRDEGVVEWLWSFAPNYSLGDDSLGISADDDDFVVPSQTEESAAMSKALKKKGYRFVGPTICYAFMQSVGMVNDHHASCFRRQPCTELAREVSS